MRAGADAPSARRERLRLGRGLGHHPPHPVLHQPHCDERGPRALERRALQRADAPHLRHHPGDQPPPDGEAARLLRQRRGQAQLDGRDRQRRGPHGKPLPCRLPYGQRRVPAPHRHPQGRHLPRLLPDHARAVYQRHQRHRLPPLAWPGQPRADRPSARADRRRLPQGRKRPGKAAQIQERRQSPGRACPHQARQQGAPCQLHRQGQRHQGRSQLPV